MYAHDSLDSYPCKNNGDAFSFGKASKRSLKQHPIDINYNKSLYNSNKGKQYPQILYSSALSKFFFQPFQ